MNADVYNQKVLATLEAIQKDVAEIKRKLSSSAAGAGSNSTNDDERVASDRDLDGEHGDPTIKYDPKEKYWKGESYVGYRFSETTPDYLDAMAKYLSAVAYMAGKDENEAKRKSARYKTLDAARARGWARRLRNGWKAAGSNRPSAPAGGGGGFDDDVGGSSYSDAEIPFVRAEPRWWRA